MKLSGLDLIGATIATDDENRSGGVYMAVVIGVLALPFLLVLPLIPGWLREQRVTRQLTIKPIDQPEWKPKKARVTKTQLLTRYPEEAIDSARRVMVAQRKDAEEATRARNVQALELAEVRRFAKNKVLATKRAATLAAKKTATSSEAA